MLANPLDESDIAALDPSAYATEWKWDGIRVQVVAGPGGNRVYSRGAEDISKSFPDILQTLDFHAVLDGELLVLRDGVVAPFADLQQRLAGTVWNAGGCESWYLDRQGRNTTLWPTFTFSYLKEMRSVDLAEYDVTQTADEPTAVPA